uniref:ATP-dependent DNA helicase n=1 Tax=Panagrolaimus sp. ES5 TaxID=591445 RepID=A0AC34GUH8_9BILA
MAHKEIMDRLLIDLSKVDAPFGGKALLLGGDFRQTLPVRKNGTRAQCLNLSIKNSGPCNNFETLSLTQNMRVETDLAEKVFGYLIEQKR